ncbi:MAG: PTS sugar transporter subunit IIA [Bacteroidota bacterium]
MLAYYRMASSPVLIANLLSEAQICVGLTGTTKAEVLAALLGILTDHPDVADAEAMQAAVLAREAMMSTGVGKGLALPHAKTEAVRETVAAFAITAEPIAYDAIDGAPVELLFLLVGPETVKTQHIRILSRVSRLLNRDAFRAEVLAASDAATVHRLLMKAELDLLAH